FAPADAALLATLERGFVLLTKKAVPNSFSHGDLQELVWFLAQIGSRNVPFVDLPIPRFVSAYVLDPVVHGDEGEVIEHGKQAQVLGGELRNALIDLHPLAVGDSGEGPVDQAVEVGIRVSGVVLTDVGVLSGRNSRAVEHL